MSEQKNNPPPEDLVVGEPRPIEFDLEKFEIPHGLKDEKTGRYTNPTEEQLKEFFTPEKIQRLIYCPQINIDQTDSWGVYGYEPGYFFIKTNKNKGVNSINDSLFVQGKSFKSYQSKSGYELSIMNHNDDFPQNKFEYNIFTKSGSPDLFNFLRKLLDGVDSDNISTWPLEDLESEAREVLLEPDLDLISIRQVIQSRLNMRRKHGLDDSIPDDLTTCLNNRIAEKIKMVPKRLELIEEYNKRGVRFGRYTLHTSYDQENKWTQLAIQKAESEGNKQLAKEIKRSFDSVKASLLSELNPKPQTPEIENK